MNFTVLVITGVAMVASVAPSFAAGTAVSTGTTPPPAVLGPYPLTAFPLGSDDPRSGLVLDVPSPLGGAVLFSEAMEILQANSPGWATWSHGFTGDIYATPFGAPPGGLSSPFAVTLDLPADTGAFLFYVQPGPFGVFNISAVLDDGTSLTQSVDGDGGATGFGFWASLGGSLLSITISSDTLSNEFDYALGEFNIARSIPYVPESGTYAVGMLALGALLIPVARRFRV